MVYYIDCSTLPLRNAIAAPWFDAGIMRAEGELASETERRVFSARFAADASDFIRMRELAEAARGNRPDRVIRRLQTTATLRGAPGVDEDEAGNAILFFPLPAAKIDKLHDVDVMRRADGDVARLAEPIKALPVTAHDVRTPLPALFSPEAWWSDTYREGAAEKKMVRQTSNALLGLFRRSTAYGAINPALFVLLPPLTPTVRLSFSVLEALLQPTTVTLPGGMPASTLRMPLVPHVGFAAADAHADLLGEMQQAQCGWERFLADRTVRGTQQRANVVLVYLQRRSPWAGALGVPMTLSENLTKLLNLLTTLGLLKEVVPPMNARDVSDALALMLDAEANAPWWRLWIVGGLDDARCVSVLLDLLNVHFANLNGKPDWSEETWDAYRRSLVARHDALTAAFNEGVVRVRAMIARYGVSADDEAAVVALVAKRRLLRFALLDVLRLQEQRVMLRTTAATMREVNASITKRLAMLPFRMPARPTFVSPHAALLATQYVDAKKADADAQFVLADVALLPSLLMTVSDTLSF